MTHEGTVALMKAVCRQWIADGKPEAGREGVEHIARCLQSVVEYNRKRWYNQAKFVAREGSHGIV